MSETTESEYYNTTYVLYENNTEETTNTEATKDTARNQTTEELPEEVAELPRGRKKEEDQKSLYDEDLYSLPAGAKVSDIAKEQLEMDQICARGKEKGGSRTSSVIVGVVFGCLLTVAIATTCYILLQKGPKGSMTKICDDTVFNIISMELIICIVIYFFPRRSNTRPNQCCD